MRRILIASLALAAAASAMAAEKPRLVIVLSIDQFRGDYLQRFADLFLPANQGGKVGGFKYLMEQGANYQDAHHAHLPTATGPGHAAILTGSAPAFHGIIGNDWFDPATKREVYCVEDPNVTTVGGTSGPMSPRNLKSTTVGDELKQATNGASKVVGVAFKDRAAILMAGHAADSVVWLDGKTGGWVSSSFYCANNQLPQWAQDINGKKLIDAAKGKTWEPLLPDKDYARARTAPGYKAPTNGKPFSHAVGSISDFTYSGFANDFVFQTAEAAIAGENLGQDDNPDILVINLSTNDYIGHAYGPNSPEVLDITVRTDRAISAFLNNVKGSVKGGLNSVLFVLTGDHGVVTVPEEARDVYRTGAARVPGGTRVKAVNDALTAKYGAGKWLLSLGEPNGWLDRDLIKSKNLDLAEVRRTAANGLLTAPGVLATFTYEDVLRNQLPAWPLSSMIALNFNPKMAGDIIVIDEPGIYLGDRPMGTGHGSPWDYDSHVPLVLTGPMVHKGTFNRRVLVADLASTLSKILGCEVPTGNIGKPLTEALDQ